MSITLSALQKQRYDTAANWTAANPTLLAGELGIESDTEKFKIGDGATAWNALAYLPGSEISAHPIATADVADSAITSAKIADGTIVNADISASAEIAVSKLGNGTARQLLQTDLAGTGVEWASNIDVPGTLDVTNAATFDNNVTIQGDLTVNGTTTTIDTTTLVVEDKNIEMGAVATPTDVTADGGGITLKGATDKTINWIDATDAWTFSEHVNIANGKEYRINGVSVLTSTTLGANVTGSSLTSVGTITTGVWNGTAITDANLATISTAGKVSNTATTATDANTANAIVARDASGNFSAGTITAALSGNATSATSAGTATTAGSLTAARTIELTGDVTGSVSTDLSGTATIATSVAAGVISTSDIADDAVTAAKLADTAVVAGSYTAADITVDAQGRITAAANGTAVVADGSITSAKIADNTIVNGDINASAAIAGSKIDPDFGGQDIATTGTVKTPAINNASASTGGVAIDVDGHVTIDGQQLPTAGPLSNRNLIINGAMQVAQRGTSATVSNGSNEGYSTVDRWFLNFNDSIGGATTFSQSTDAPAGFANSAKIQCSTTASSFSSNQYLALQHKFEAQNLQSLAYGTADAKSITVSWYMKTDVYTDPISFALFTEDGTAEYYTVSVTPTTSWARYSVTVPGSSTATINNDNGAGLFLQFVLAGNTSSAIAAASDSTAYSTTRGDFRTDVGNFLSSTSNAIYITGVQLEVGSKATPFEHRSYGDELARCQRYYYTHAVGTSSSDIGVGVYYTNTLFAFTVRFPVTMRIPPDLDYESGSAYYSIFRNGTTDTFDAMVSANRVTENTMGIDTSTGTSGTVNWGGLVSTNNASAYMAFDSEL